MPVLEKLGRVLELQLHYNKNKSAEMDERRQLVEYEIPEELTRLLDTSEFAISREHRHLGGGSGTGLNAKVPWVQVSDSRNSTSPQVGWYLVLLFSEDGSGVYASVNKNSTYNPGGSGTWDAQPLNAEDLKRDRRWAQELLQHRIGSSQLDLTDRMDLRSDSKLAQAYERTHVTGVYYSGESLPDDDTLVAGLSELAEFLDTIYLALPGDPQDSEATMQDWSSYLELQEDDLPFDLLNDSPDPMPRDHGPKQSLEELAKALYLESASELREIVDMLDDRSQAIFYGPPGTGKTWVARELAKWLAGSEDRVELVQFHPSYGYEDFIEGWRPTESGFEIKPGPLKRLAKRATEDPDQKFVLVIDEINRANLSKVLGELFFLFEYRSEKVTLQYSEERFSLPGNLKIIGTMNTADRSIALVDAALRRRFHFHPFFPDRPPIKGLLNRWLTQNQPDLIRVAGLVDRANGLLDDQNMAIGPSHFMKMDLTNEKVQQIWRRSVIPFIEDQFFDEPVRVKQFTYEALTQADSTEPDNEDADPSAD